MMYSLRALRRFQPPASAALQIPGPVAATVAPLVPQFGALVRTEGFRTDHDDALRWQQVVAVDSPIGRQWQVQHVMVVPDDTGHTVFSLENHGAPEGFAQAVQRIAGFEALQHAIGATVDPETSTRRLGMLHFPAFCAREGYALSRAGLPSRVRSDGSVLEAGDYDAGSIEAARRGLELHRALGADRGVSAAPSLAPKPDWLNPRGVSKPKENWKWAEQHLAKLTLPELRRQVEAAINTGSDNFRDSFAYAQKRGVDFDDDWCDRMLLAASRTRRSYDTVTALLHLGASIDRVQQRGGDLIRNCADANSVHAAAILLSAGARAHSRADLDKLLEGAIDTEQVADMDVLLAAGASTPTTPRDLWNVPARVLHTLLAYGMDTALLRSGKDPALLHYARASRDYGSDGKLKLLLAHGADADICDATGHSALVEATMNRHWNLVQLLLVHGARTDCPGADANTLLDIMVLQEAPDAALALAVQNTPVAALADATVSGRPLAQVFAAHGCPEALRQVLARVPCRLSAADPLGRTPLHLALLAGQDATAIALLDLGADPARPAADGSTPLHCLSQRKGCNATALHLLDGPQAPTLLAHLQEEAGTALLWAIHRRDLALVDRVLALRPQDAAALPPGHPPALVLAQKLGEDRLVERLLAAPGLPLDAADADGSTAPIWAVRRNQHASLRRLAAAGCDLNAVDIGGDSALAWTYRLKDSAGMALLLELGAKPVYAANGTHWSLKRISETGDSPLFVADRLPKPKI